MEDGLILTVKKLLLELELFVFARLEGFASVQRRTEDIQVKRSKTFTDWNLINFYRFLLKLSPCFHHIFLNRNNSIQFESVLIKARFFVLCNFDRFL